LEAWHFDNRIFCLVQEWGGGGDFAARRGVKKRVENFFENIFLPKKFEFNFASTLGNGFHALK
jgi:hypothetical protein